MITHWTIDLHNKAERWFYISVWIFVFVLILSVWLYIYNIYIEKDIENIQSEKESIAKKVSDLQNDEKIQLYSLLNENKAYLEKIHKFSRINDYIKELNTTASKFNISLTWFQYWNGKISTQWLAEDDINLWWEKTKNFIEYYRKEKKDYTLWFINTFQWSNSIQFSVQLDIQ